MKKIIYTILVLGLFFTACDPMDDINATIDATETPIVGEATYTLTDDDYDELDLGFGSFSSLDDAKELLPPFFADMFPVWGKNSSILAGFKLYVGNAPGVNDYTYADDYSLSNTDYPRGGDNAIGFFPEEDPENFIGDILTAAINNPTEGENVLAKFKQYIGEPTFGVADYFEETFNGSLGTWENINVVGDQDWYDSSYSSDEYAKISGYSSGAQDNENWLISPEVDLTGQTNSTLSVRQAINYASDQTDLMKILISTNYTTGGDHTAATWDIIDLQNTPPGTNWDFVTSDAYDLTAYEGETVHIALKYESTTSVAATWEVDHVVIKTPGVEGETIRKETFFTYSGGEWEASEGVYFVSDADFDSMGEASGQPGRYNNFGSTTPPDDYLPTFLGLKFPYAMEEDELLVIYDYFSSSSGAQLRGNLYTVIDGAWVGHQSTINTTLQLGHDGNTWVPDNTIKYTLSDDDYVWLAAELEGVPGYEDLTASLGNYKDFDYHWTMDQLVYSLGLLADHLNPGAQEGQKYVMTYLLYDNGIQTRVTPIIKTGGVWVLNN